MKKREKQPPPQPDDEFEAFEEWDEGSAPSDRDEEGSGGGFLDEGLDDIPEGAVPEGAAEGEAGGQGGGEQQTLPEKAPDVTAKQRRSTVSPKAEPEPPRKFERAAFDLAPDVPVQVVAVMGKRGLTIKELMEFRLGQVIDLKRPPNETVDIVVNGKLFARGELVEIDGKLGAKITQLVR